MPQPISPPPVSALPKVGAGRAGVLDAAGRAALSAQLVPPLLPAVAFMGGIRAEMLVAAGVAALSAAIVESTNESSVPLYEVLIYLFTVLESCLDVSGLRK